MSLSESEHSSPYGSPSSSFKVNANSLEDMFMSTRVLPYISSVLSLSSRFAEIIPDTFPIRLNSSSCRLRFFCLGIAGVD